MTIEMKASSRLPTRFGKFQLQVFADQNGVEHLVLSLGRVGDGCLVRLHSECATGDLLGSLRCDCRDQLELALKKIAEEGNGLFIYMRGHEGRGIGLVNKVKAYALQDKGLDTVDANIRLGFEADQRDYDSSIEILRHYGLNWVRLLTNNRHKIQALEKAGIEVAEHIPLWAAVNPHNEGYIDTKRRRMGHIGLGQVVQMKARKRA
ncbi:MAG TPA: GTP cyclohydrolase II [Alphaproteobacteria bacterium]|nr:GTP cyclohydrolase II [Alphaproteobacteria bacterium]